MTTINYTKMNLIFFGIQGSGKGTQAKLLAEKFGFKIFETGAELRTLAAQDNELGKKVKSIIEAGHLVSSELVLEIVENFVQNNLNNSVIFDGIPRNEDQNIAFKGILEKYNIQYTAIHFKLEKDEALKRLFKRAEIENRADDNEESINRRINIFYNDTLPIIESFQAIGKLVEVDASPSIEEIFTDLTKKLELK
jgi:adenylate kinase